MNEEIQELLKINVEIWKEQRKKFFKNLFRYLLKNNLIEKILEGEFSTEDFLNTIMNVDKSNPPERKIQYFLPERVYSQFALKTIKETIEEAEKNYLRWREVVMPALQGYIVQTKKSKKASALFENRNTLIASLRRRKSGKF